MGGRGREDEGGMAEKGTEDGERGYGRKGLGGKMKGGWE